MRQSTRLILWPDAAALKRALASGHWDPEQLSQTGAWSHAAWLRGVQ